MPSAPSLMPRTVPLWAAAVVALLLVWRVLVSGIDAMRATGVLAAPPESASPLEARIGEQGLRARLNRNPADAVALLAIGRMLEQSGQRTEARDAIRQALRLAPVERATLSEAANLSLRAGDEDGALAILRRLAEYHPAARPEVWPLLTQALDGRQHAAYFAAVAKEGPFWWGEFFQYACEKARSAEAIQALLVARASGSTAKDDERRCAIGRLQRENQWPAAYQAWIGTLPPEQRQRIGYIFNGGFEFPLSNLGFDWIAPDRSAVNVTAEKTDGVIGARGLHVVFLNKRYAGPVLHQYILLAPGRYRLEGRGRAEGLSSWLGVQWGLYCLDAGPEPRQLAHTDGLLGSSDWTEFRHELTVARDCPVQILRLELANPRRDARAGGNVAVRLRGGVWFDELRLQSID